MDASAHGSTGCADGQDRQTGQNKQKIQYNQIRGGSENPGKEGVWGEKFGHQTGPHFL